MNLEENLRLLKKISENLNDEPIPVEDLFLLECIYERSNSPENIELQKNINWYFSSFKMYDSMGDSPILIKWSKRIEYLLRRGLLEAPYGKWYSTDKNGFIQIDFLKLEVTEKFKKNCLVDPENKTSIWELFVDEFGEFYYKDGKKLSYRTPSKEIRERGLTSEEDMINRFWKLCGNGKTSDIRFVFEVMYELKKSDMVYSLGRFLLDFNSIRKILKL